MRPRGSNLPYLLHILRFLYWYSLFTSVDTSLVTQSFSFTRTLFAAYDGLLGISTAEF